jgi:hypothetical protein
MADDPSGASGSVLKLSLIGLFLTSIGLAGIGPFRRYRPSIVEIGLLGLASYRIGHMVAYEAVARPLREPFTDTVPDGAGELTVVASGRGPRYALGELLSCPLCAGTWAALGLYIGLAVLPGPTRMLINVLAATSVVEFTNAFIQRLESTSG